MNWLGKNTPTSPSFIARSISAGRCGRRCEEFARSLLVLAELELWPNLIRAAKQQGARVAIINGRMSDKSFPRYRRIRPLVAHLLRKIDYIAVQNVESAARFQKLGAPADRVHITGSLKFDGAETDRGNPRTTALRRLAAFADDDIIFLAGSTQEPEEQIAIDIYRRLAAEQPRLRLVLVPRHPERFESVAKLLDASELPWVRRTQLEPSPSPSLQGRGMNNSRDATHRRPIVLVDTVGELGAWWGTAAIAFVGGSFGSRGGQNMIEPAAYGAAVAFGPNTWNFRDIVGSLQSADAAVVVRNRVELEAFVRRCLEEPHYAAELGSRSQNLVKGQLGATRRTLARLESLLSVEAIRQVTKRTAA